MAVMWFIGNRKCCMLALHAPSFALRIIMMNPGLILYDDMTKALLCCDNVSLTGWDVCVIVLMFFCQFPGTQLEQTLRNPRPLYTTKYAVPWVTVNFHAISVTVTLLSSGTMALVSFRLPPLVNLYPTNAPLPFHVTSYERNKKFKCPILSCRGLAL